MYLDLQTNCNAFRYCISVNCAPFSTMWVRNSWKTLKYESSKERTVHGNLHLDPSKTFHRKFWHSLRQLLARPLSHSEFVGLQEHYEPFFGRRRYRCAPLNLMPLWVFERPNGQDPQRRTEMFFIKGYYYRLVYNF